MTEELRMKDIYDEGIEYLTENPEVIHEAWNDPQRYEGRGGELFGFVGPDWTCNGQVMYDTRGIRVGTCGCLQQIRAAKKEGYDGKNGDMCMSHWPELWREIASDRRLPSVSEKITVADLPVFAEWQRRIDLLRMQE